MKTLGGDQIETEETGSTPVGTEVGRVKQEPRRFLAIARRDLSEDELATPAARRFLIAEIERLDGLCADAMDTAERYNDLRVEYAVLVEREKVSKWRELLSVVSITVGGAGIGAAPSYLAIKDLASLGWVFAIGSGVLLAVGILSKVVK